MLKPINILIACLLLLPTLILAQRADPQTFIFRNSKVAEESGFPVNFHDQSYSHSRENKMVVSAIDISEEVTPEEAVWKLEEAYWIYVKNNDLESYTSLWDEDFVGWPDLSPNPLFKKNITDWIPPLHENSAKTYDYEVQKKAVRAFGDIVVVHYLVHHLWRNQKEGEIQEKSEPIRITHTWEKKRGSWYIITGMSAGYSH